MPILLWGGENNWTDLLPRDPRSLPSFTECTLGVSGGRLLKFTSWATSRAAECHSLQVGPAACRSKCHCALTSPVPAVHHRGTHLCGCVGGSRWLCCLRTCLL